MMIFRVLLGTGNGWLAATCAALAAFGLWRAFDVQKQRAIGESTAVAKIEKATDDAIKTSQTAATKSADPRARGMRNPYLRRD